MVDNASALPFSYNSIDHYYHFLSVITTITTSNKCLNIGKQVMAIFFRLDRLPYRQHNLLKTALNLALKLRIITKTLTSLVTPSFYFRIPINISRRNFLQIPREQSSFPVFCFIRLLFAKFKNIIGRVSEPP